MPCGWEGNRRSGVALAMRHRHWWFYTYGLMALEREMSTPPIPSRSVAQFNFTQYTGRTKKSIPLTNFANFSRTVWRYDIKFYTLVTHSGIH